MSTFIYTFLSLLLFQFLNQTNCLISGNLTVTSSTINANGVYYFIIDTTTIIPSGGYMTVTFPSAVTLSSTATCTIIFGFSATPTCTVSGNVMKFSGTSAFPNLNGIQFKISYATNPGSAQYVNNFIVSFYKTLTATTTLDVSSSSTFYQQYTSDTITSATLIPSSYVVGTYTSWRLSVTPKNKIPIGGIIKVYFPKWNSATLYSIGAYSILTSGSNTCSVVTGLSATGMTCSFYIDPSSSNKDVLTIYNAFPTAAQLSGITFQIDISNVRNMPTTRPYTTFDVYTYDSSSYAIDSLSSITVTMTTAATLPSSQVSITVDAPTTIDASTTYLFQIFVNNPIPMGGVIKITIPSTIGVTSLTTVVSEQRINSAVVVSAVSGTNPRYVQLTGGYPTLSDSVPIAGLVAFRLQYLTNPSTTTTTSSFQIETYDSSYLIETITSGLTIKATNGIITMNSLTYSEYKVLEYNSISFDFTLASALQSGSTIVVTFPSEFTVSTVSTSSCSLTSVSGLTSGYSCSITSNVLTITAPFGTTTTTGGERVKFTVSNSYIQNPTSTRPTTTGIIVKTVSSAGNTVDIYTASKFTATVNQLSSVTVSASSYVAGNYPTTYTFTIKTPYKVEMNAYMLMKFPSDFYIIDTSSAEKSCSATLTLSSITCKAKAAQITISKGFSTGVCACTTSIIFTVPGFVNPRSLTPTSSIEVYFYTSDNYKIYEKTTSITLTMTTADTKAAVSITQSNGQNGAVDNYIFTYKNNNEHYDGDYFFLNAPSNVTFQTNSVCAAKTNVKGFVYCAYVNSSRMKISLAYSRRRMLSGEIAVNEGFSFQILNIINPPSFKPTSSFTITSFTNKDYAISSVTSGVTVTNYKTGNFTFINILPTVYADGQWTNLTFTVIPQNYLQNMILKIKIPTDVPLVSSSTTVCSAVSTYSVSSSLICDYTSSSRTITISNAFTLLATTTYKQYSTNLQKLQFTIGQFINPSNQTYSGNFTFSTFDVYGYSIDSYYSPISYVCSSTCSSCSSSDYSKCTACNQSSSYKYLYQGACVSACPSGATLSDGKCIYCSSTCSKCLGYDSEDCATCKAGYYYLNGQCVLECPEGYYLSDKEDTCLKSIANTVDFIQYFQKDETKTCYTFVFSYATILTAVGVMILSIIYRILVTKKIRKLTQQKKLIKGETDMNIQNTLKVLEMIISAVSFVELLGWVFFLYCMNHVDDKIPQYVIAIAIGVNIIFNLIMVFKVYKQIRKDEQILTLTEQNKKCFNCIRIFSLVVSHKGFYMNYYKYRNQEYGTIKTLDFSYIDSNFYRIFFLLSVFIVHGCVIAACVLNYINNNLSQKLFCLDIDIVCMTFFQAILILITLITCSCSFSRQRLDENKNVTKKRQSPNKREEKERSPQKGRREQKQTVTTNKYMKSQNYDSEEDLEQIETSRSQFKTKSKLKFNQVTDHSLYDNSNSLQNTRTKMIKNSKEVQRREEQLKSILNNVKTKGVKFLDENDDEEHIEETFNQDRRDDRTELYIEDLSADQSMIQKKRINRNIIDDFEDENVNNKTKVINNETIFNNTDENDTSIIKQTRRNNKITNIVNRRDNTTVFDESKTNQSARRLKNTRNTVIEDDEQIIQQSFKIANTIQSEDSIQIINKDQANSKNKTQKIFNQVQKKQTNNLIRQLTENEMKKYEQIQRINRENQEMTQLEEQIMAQVEPFYSKVENNKEGSTLEHMSNINRQYSVINGSLPTLNDEQMVMPTKQNAIRNNVSNKSYNQEEEFINQRENRPYFGKTNQYSLPTQNDEMIVNPKDNKAYFNQINQINTLSYNDEQILGNNPVYEKINNNNNYSYPTQNEEQFIENRSNLPAFENMQYSQLDKTQEFNVTQSDFNKTGQLKNKALSPNKEQKISPIKRNENVLNSISPFQGENTIDEMRTQEIHQIHEKYSETEDDEARDQVNQNDIKPKRNIIFSDKSESSVEEMMEDTPSNYNIPNGRLDEASKGLRSLLYKSIAKQFLHKQITGVDGETGREDQEAQNISRKNSERKLGMTPSQVLLAKKFDTEKEQAFVKNLVKQQEESLKGKLETINISEQAKTYRKSSIGEIDTRNLDKPKNIETENNIKKLYRHKTPMRQI